MLHLHTERWGIMNNDDTYRHSGINNIEPIALLPLLILLLHYPRYLNNLYGLTLISNGKQDADKLARPFVEWLYINYLHTHPPFSLPPGGMKDRILIKERARKSPVRPRVSYEAE